MTALIILAAGESSRLGFPKQTLLYKGKTLLEIAIEAGLKSKCSIINVVLGANAETFESGIRQFDVNFIHNQDWRQGMASSIRAGIASLKCEDDVDGAVIMLCDQPFVTKYIIDNLIYKQQATGKQIIASSYKDTLGVPALFKRSLFAELLSLNGQEGAKKIIQQHPEDIAAISFEKGGIDIDTIGDYENLINNF